MSSLTIFIWDHHTINIMMIDTILPMTYRKVEESARFGNFFLEWLITEEKKHPRKTK